MASVGGGLFHPASPTPSQVTPSPRPDAGHLSLGSVTDDGGSHSGGSGFDTVNAPQADLRVAGSLPAGTEQVVATQTQAGGNLVLHLSDGSMITIAGVTHLDANFIH
jgi:hypothetical protein